MRTTTGGTTALAEPGPRPPRPKESPQWEDRRGTPAALFALYLALLVWAVLWKLGVPGAETGGWRRVKLTPFVSSDGDGASEPSEVVANLLLFVPLGVYLGLLAPRWPWWNALGAGAALSLGLETVQYVLALGGSDSTDVLVNAAGTLAGFGLLALARVGLGARTAAVATRVCLLGTVLAVLACGAFFASPVRYAQRDVHRDVPPAPAHATPWQETGGGAP